MGARAELDLTMRDPELEQCFPKLQTGAYRITSPEDPKYNCVAFALGCVTLFFQRYSFPSKTYYWPPQVERDDTVESWMKVFALHGYMPCDNGELESGVEKIAIYVGTDGEPSHVAKQLPSGWWQSKLGSDYDIEHETLDLLAGEDEDEYGTVQVFMKR